MAAFDHLRSPFLASLAAAGVELADVDLVINTHLHVDHAGCNTTLRDGGWVPTFPNARYLMAAPDVAFWNPANGHQRRGELVNEFMFEDSVAPVLEAGLVQIWDDRRVIDENLTLDLAPGCTPGMSVVPLQSGNDRAVFVGDLPHSPVQLLDPHANSCFCEGPAQAVRSRLRVLGWTADHRALVLPAHFRGGHAVEIARAGDRFRITDCASFTQS